MWVLKRGAHPYPTGLFWGSLFLHHQPPPTQGRIHPPGSPSHPFELPRPCLQSFGKAQSRPHPRPEGTLWGRDPLPGSREAAAPGLLQGGSASSTPSRPDFPSVSVCPSWPLSSQSIPYLPTSSAWLKLEPLPWPLLHTDSSWGPTISPACASPQLPAASPPNHGCPAFSSAQTLRFLAQS